MTPMYVFTLYLPIYRPHSFSPPLSSRHSLEAILISRFLLNLRQLGPGTGQTPLHADGGAISSDGPVFRAQTVADTIMGNMGATVHDGFFEDDALEEPIGDEESAGDEGDRSSSNRADEEIVEVRLVISISLYFMFILSNCR